MAAPVHVASAKSRCEKTPLLSERRGTYTEHLGPVEVVPLKYGGVPTGADTVFRAFLNDSIMVYYRLAETAPLYETRWKLRHNLTLLDAVHQRRVLTVNQGAAILEYGAPGNNEPSRIYKFLFSLLETFDSRELTRRKTEWRGLAKSLLQETFGERLKDMYDIQILATAPSMQGKGYGSALVTAVTDMADAEGCDICVLSSDAYHFYERLGFVVVREAVLGRDNPEWHGEPIAVHLLHRPARAVPPIATSSPLESGS
ncbi:hypothetical protein OH77DRAFT_740427 [Trametes cingulata]|nr:hypothetical protein OH77DRAFT_740427 [Trametes cingulata]